jgi:uncharacterized protein (TIGR00290 family)
MQKPKAVMNWSGGKDSALALQRVLESGEYEVKFLLTTVNEKWQRISMHGVRRELLRKQAEALGIELLEVFLPEVSSMSVYDEKMDEAMDFLLGRGITHSIFGDIFLEDLREYRESQLARKSMKGVFPLWKMSTSELIEELVFRGFRAITVCVDASKLGAEFCGREVDEAFVRDLPPNIDPCGENGEFHTFVYDAPCFKNPIPVRKGQVVYREYRSNGDSAWSNRFFYCDLLLAEDSGQVLSDLQ